MTYIGQQPATTFDSGIQDRFTGLTTNTVTLNHEISAEEDILVVWNNIVQDKNTYSVGGTGNKTVTLGGTLVSGDVVTVYYLNKVMQSVNPTAGSVNTTQLADTSITAVKLNTAILTGQTDIGADIADADLFLVDDGAGGTVRKTAASRLKTYITAGLTKLADVTITDGDASEQINGCFSDTYESYLIQCLGFGVNAEALVYVQGVYSTDTVISAGYYHIARGHNEDGDAGTDTGSNTSQGEIFGTSLLANEWNFANIWYHRPASVGSFKQRLFGNSSHIRHSGSKLHGNYFAIGIDNTNKLTGLKFSTSTSTYKQGQVIVWGYST